MSWENCPDGDAFLEELEYNENGGLQFTQRAMKARITKMKKLYDIYAPMRRIPKHLAPGQDYVPPTKMLDPRIVITPDEPFDPRYDGQFLLNYGWGFTDEFAFDYAKRHSLELELDEDFHIELAGREIIKCAELADDPSEKQNDALWQEMCILARDAVLKHIRKEVGFTLSLGHPFCDEYPSMIVLYTNYNAMKRVWIIERVTRERMSNHIQRLSKIMAEPGEETKEIMWWYARENPISLSMTSVD